jgi:hypothetical protein
MSCSVGQIGRRWNEQKNGSEPRPRISKNRGCRRRVHNIGYSGRSSRVREYLGEYAWATRDWPRYDGGSDDHRFCLAISYQSRLDIVTEYKEIS